MNEADILFKVLKFFLRPHFNDNFSITYNNILDLAIRLLMTFEELYSYKWQDFNREPAFLSS